MVRFKPSSTWNARALKVNYSDMQRRRYIHIDRGEAKFIRLSLSYPLDRSVQRQQSIARVCYHEDYAYFTNQSSMRIDKINSNIVIKNCFIAIFKFD